MHHFQTSRYAKGGRILTAFKYILIKSTACWLVKQSLQKRTWKSCVNFRADNIKIIYISEYYSGCPESLSQHHHYVSLSTDVIQSEFQTFGKIRVLKSSSKINQTNLMIIFSRLTWRTYYIQKFKKPYKIALVVQWPSPKQIKLNWTKTYKPRPLWTIWTII